MAKPFLGAVSHGLTWGKGAESSRFTIAIATPSIWIHCSRRKTLLSLLKRIYISKTVTVSDPPARPGNMSLLTQTWEHSLSMYVIREISGLCGKREQDKQTLKDSKTFYWRQRRKTERRVGRQHIKQSRGMHCFVQLLLMMSRTGPCDVKWKNHKNYHIGLINDTSHRINKWWSAIPDFVFHITGSHAYCPGFMHWGRWQRVGNPQFPYKLQNTSPFTENPLF